MPVLLLYKCQLKKDKPCAIYARDELEGNLDLKPRTTNEACIHVIYNRKESLAAVIM